jgi:hypothetical protein
MKQHECAATKLCKTCNTEKSVSEYHSYFDNRKGKTYLKGKCKLCENAKEKERYNSNEQARLFKLANQAVKRSTDEFKKKSSDYHKGYNVLNAGKISIQKKEYRNKPDVIAREKARLAKTYAENKDLIVSKRKAFYEANPERLDAIREYHKQHFKENVSYYTEKTERYRTRAKRAKPIWYNAAKIIELRKEARRLTLSTGVQHEVDHIVPLQGELVTGLHWHGNMQILTKLDNIRKSNKHLG